jgi:hypothetical protein
MSLVTRTDQNTKPQVQGCGSNGEVVRGKTLTVAAQMRKQPGPVGGRSLVEGLNPGELNQFVDTVSTLSSPSWRIGQLGAHEEFREYDHREGDLLESEGCQHVGPCESRPLDGDGRAGIDYESQGFGSG